MAIISVKSVKLSAPPRTAANTLWLGSCASVASWLASPGWLVREVWTSSSWVCARAPRGVRPGCEVVHLDTGGVELGPEVLQHPQVRHQRREELRRHPGVESHLAGLVIGILKDFQCNDSLTGAVSIME